MKRPAKSSPSDPTELTKSPAKPRKPGHKPPPRVVIGLPYPLPVIKRGWWWRNLSRWAAELDSIPATPGDWLFGPPQVQLIRHLRRVADTPLINEVLARLLERELEHRIDGGARWRGLPSVEFWGEAHPAIKRANAAAAPITIRVNLRADLSVKTATAAFIRAFKQARAAHRRTAPPVTTSNRTRGEKHWADVFRVIELLDLRLAGEPVDNDDLALVRALLRRRSLVLKKDCQPRR